MTEPRLQSRLFDSGAHTLKLLSYAASHKMLLSALRTVLLFCPRKRSLWNIWKHFSYFHSLVSQDFPICSLFPLYWIIGYFLNAKYFLRLPTCFFLCLKSLLFYFSLPLTSAHSSTQLQVFHNAQYGKVTISLSPISIHILLFGHLS